MRNKPAMLLAVIVVLSLATAAVASAADRVVPGPPDAFQVRYASNLTVPGGDSVVNITNAGTQGGFDPAGDICSNVYVFYSDEEMAECCSCIVTPNGLRALSVKNDLTSNPLTGVVPTSVVIKLLATTRPSSGGCDASSPKASSPNASNLAPGMRAWGTTLHALPTSPVTYGVAETQFSPAVLRASELEKLTSDCGNIEGNGSGHGICSCGITGGL